MIFHQLQFEELNTHHGKVWRAEVPFFQDFYAVWIDRDTGKTKILYPGKGQTFDTSLENAKGWCQRDFEHRLRKLVQPLPSKDTTAN